MDSTARDSTEPSDLGADAPVPMPIQPIEDEASLAHRTCAAGESEASGEAIAALFDRWIVAEMEADAIRDEESRRRVGDPDHPINAEKIKQGLGCIPDLCEVEIDPYHTLYGQVVIRHRVPAHERIYRVTDRFGYVKREVKQVFALERGSQIAIDPYMLDRHKGDAEDIAREIVRRMRYEWNESWSHHA